MTPYIIKKVAGRLLSTDICERFAEHAGLQHQLKPVLATPNFESLPEFWNFCIDRIGPGKKILFLEFGVWQGRSMAHFSAGFANAGSRFIGCDSFEGLPEDWGSCKNKTFSTEGKMPQTTDSRVTFVKGWFQNSFDDAIQLARKLIPTPDEVLVHFDADLYSSTLFLLSRLHREFDQYFFIFDEFVWGESRALLNFQQAYGVDLEFYGHCNGALPEQVFGRLNNMKGKYRPGAGQISWKPAGTRGGARGGI
ncbi:MAG: class I SAM-dependent methyltransferase [Verrucomicrobiota bacterium]|jgi:hypothetical protein